MATIPIDPLALLALISPFPPFYDAPPGVRHETLDPRDTL